MLLSLAALLSSCGINDKQNNGKQINDKQINGKDFFSVWKHSIEKSADGEHKDINISFDLKLGKFNEGSIITINQNFKFNNIEEILYISCLARGLILGDKSNGTIDFSSSFFSDSNSSTNVPKEYGRGICKNYNGLYNYSKTKDKLTICKKTNTNCLDLN